MIKRNRVQKMFTKPSLTKQSFKDAVNINKIMERYKKTGVLPINSYKNGVYGDFSNFVDYRDSLEKLMNAEEAFMALPSAIRNRFENDPGNLIEFLQDVNNKDEAIKMGLIEVKEEEDKKETVQAEPSKVKKPKQQEQPAPLEEK